MRTFDNHSCLERVISLRKTASSFDRSITEPEALTANSKPAKGYAYLSAREENVGIRVVSANSGNSTKFKSCDEGSSWL